MLFKKKKAAAAQSDIESKIISLQTQREETKTRIRKLRAEMQLLIQQATEADDLDRKMLSMDYESRKNTLAVETEHFADLSRLITQLRNIQLEQARQRTFTGIETVSGGIDTDALIRAEDELNVRRSLMQEEDERLDAVFSAANADLSPFQENEEFARLVRQAKADQAAARQQAGIPVPAMEKAPVTA